jgi:hypothetical protein
VDVANTTIQDDVHQGQLSINGGVGNTGFQRLRGPGSPVDISGDVLVEQIAFAISLAAESAIDRLQIPWVAVRVPE